MANGRTANGRPHGHWSNKFHGPLDSGLVSSYLIVVKDTNHTQRKTQMTLKPFSILYTRNSRFTPKVARNFDPTLLTFKCAAVSEKDAVRQLRNSLKFSTKNAKGRETLRTKRFKVVRISTSDVPMFKDGRGRIVPNVTVIPSRKPRWMNRNFFGSR